MIEKYASCPDSVESDPVFSTNNFDVFLLRTPWEFEGDSHVETLDMYFAFKREREYCRPDCIVWIDHERLSNGSVLNRVTRCSVYPMNVDACLDNELSISAANYAATLKKQNLSTAAEVLRGIREFAGPLGDEILRSFGAAALIAGIMSFT